MSVLAYGVTFPDTWTPFQCELFLFTYGNQLVDSPYWRPRGCFKGEERSPSPNSYTGEGRYTHFRALVEMVFPKMFEWNEWSDKIARALCENKSTAICGCGGSSKSTTTGMYALFWYIAAPNNSAVLIASTTLDAAKKRIWKEVRRFYVEFVRQVRKLGTLEIVNSPKPAIRPVDPAHGADSAHGMYVVAVAKGEEQKGIDTLKGFHPDRLLMIGDETDSISQAVVDVGANQEIGTMEYQTIWLGNDPSLFNPLGQMMQPEIGKTVGLQHVEWTSTKGYKCLRLDAFDSPNIRDKDKWKGIIRQKDIKAIMERYGENHPQVWIMLRGIHPPEGADSTVVSEALLLRYHTSEGVTWKRNFILSSCVDPAFGGDRCTYRTYMRGNDTSGKMRILMGEKIEIPISGNDPTNPPEYQIARKVKELNQARGIPPEEFNIDKTGTGQGAAAVLQREWSPNINTCRFGGTPSEFSVSDEDPRPANEAYDRKVTELWYSIREFIEADMIRGMDTETARELCARRFEIKAKKISVEPKEEMKERGIASPDWGDNFAVYIDMLREKKGIGATVMTEVKKDYTQDYYRRIKEMDLDSEGTYQPALDDAMVPDYMNF